MLGIRKHKAAKPFGVLSSSRMLGAQALKQAGFPDGIWAPCSWLLRGGSLFTKAAPRRLRSHHHLEAQGSASSFLGRTLFCTPPGLHSSRAGACSLLIRAGKFGCTSGQLQGGGAQCPLLCLPHLFPHSPRSRQVMKSRLFSVLTDFWLTSQASAAWQRSWHCCESQLARGADPQCPVRAPRGCTLPSPHLPAGLRCPEAEMSNPSCCKQKSWAVTALPVISSPQLGLFTGILFQKMSESLMGISLACTTGWGLLAKK